MDGNENLKATKATADNIPREKDQEIDVMGELPLPRLYTVTEVAKYLRLSRSQVYAMIQKNELPIIWVSEHRIVVSESDLVAWIQRHKAYEPSQLVFMLDRIVAD
jgi:excisionase family DNA binding protein